MRENPILYRLRRFLLFLYGAYPIFCTITGHDWRHQREGVVRLVLLFQRITVLRRIGYLLACGLPYKL
jgi:hypothetical protein